MKRFFIFLCFSCCCLSFTSFGQVSLIMNGSFEQNGKTIDDITTEVPLYWCDVNVPAGKFNGKIKDDWWTHSGDGTDLSLELRSRAASLNVGDYAEVSQNVFIENDVKALTFDLKLTTLGGEPWTADQRSAFVKIDNEIIWNSDSLPIDANGEYIGTVIIDSNNFSSYLDANEHTLSLGMRSNIKDFAFEFYITKWDFVKFDKYCGGLGYLASDLNMDCYVDLEDFSVLALQWLSAPAGIKDDLIEDGVIDNADLAILADEWLYNTDWAKWGQDSTLEIGRLSADYDLSGEVDLPDLMVIAENWLTDSATCSPLDLDGDGDFDMYDYAILAGQWKMRDWLYYRN